MKALAGFARLAQRVGRLVPAPASARRRRRSLARAQARFLSALPAAARAFPTVVVLADDGPGAAELIRAATGWQRRARRLLPSAPDVEGLGLYLGDGVIVQALAPSLVADTSRAARRALRALWKPLARRRPVAVAVISAAAVRAADPEALRSRGELARGKLDLLAGRARGPVEVRVCVTGMDALPGFRELAALLAEEGASFQVDLARAAEPGALARGLATHEAWLPVALATRPPEEFRSIVAFFAEAERLLGALAPLVEALGAAERLAPATALGTLSLGAAGPDVVLGEPFAVDGARAAAELRQAERRRLRWSAAIAGALALVLGGIHLRHASALARAEGAVAALDEAVVARGEVVVARGAGPSLDPEAAAREAVAGLDDLARAERLWPLLPGAAADRKRAARAALLDDLRAHYLLARLRPDRSLADQIHTAALVYAAPDSELGERITADARAWSERLEIPEDLLAAYIRLSPGAWPEPIEVPPAAEAPAWAGADLEAWEAFLGRVSLLLAAEAITPQALAAAQADAAPLGEALDGVGPYQRLEPILAELARVAPFDVDAAFGEALRRQAPPRWAMEREAPLRAVIARVREARLDRPAVAGAGLGEVLARVGAPPAAEPAPPPPEPIDLQLGRRALRFDPAAWDALLVRSRGALLVDAFLEDVGRTGRPAFFRADAGLPAAGVSPSPGRGAAVPLPGVYTRAAFDEHVRPALTDLDERLAAAPLPAATRAALAAFALEESRRYALAYRDALQRYWRGFDLGPLSAATLDLDLAEMAAPGSWFERFLRAAAENAAIEAPPGRYFAPMAEIAPAFRPLVALVAPDKPESPALQKYGAVLGKAAAALAARLPPAPEGAPLAEALSPVGQAALAMLQGGEGSLLAEVQAWLVAAGLPGSLRGPFLAPAQAVQRIGMRAIEVTVAERWRDEAGAEAARVLSRFPFDPGAELAADPGELAAVLGPKGRVRDAFQRLLEPLCERRGRGWAARRTAAGRVRLPSGALALAGYAEELGAALWAEDGSPRAIVVRVRPQPLPAGAVSGGQVATLGYLRAGGAAAYGFNQAPGYQQVAIAWHEAAPAAVGLELRGVSEGFGRERVVSVPAEPWSFYRLLRRGRVGAGQVVAWTLPGEGAGDAALTVGFGFQADPWARLRPPAEVRAGVGSGSGTGRGGREG